jgi:hypothetical protein
MSITVLFWDTAESNARNHLKSRRHLRSKQTFSRQTMKSGQQAVCRVFRSRSQMARWDVSPGREGRPLPKRATLKRVTMHLRPRYSSRTSCQPTPTWNLGTQSVLRFCPSIFPSSRQGVFSLERHAAVSHVAHKRTGNWSSPYNCLVFLYTTQKSYFP